MKSILVFLIITILVRPVPSESWTDESRKIESQQVSLWVNKLRLAKNNPSVAGTADLALGLRNMGHRKSFEGHSSSVDAIYADLQTELLSIAGYAQYLADEIELEQKAVAAYPTGTGPRVSYDRQRGWYFEILSHLPSPETIAVLGKFLADDKDKPLERISRHSDWGENASANSENSAYTLIDIGLRNPPVAPAMREKIDPDVCLAEARAWWEEIKSGRSTFSFLGQKVEYRFNPDGTWEKLAMVNPPDDDPKKSTTQERVSKRFRKAQDSSDSRMVQGINWKWIVTGLMVFIVAALGLLIKKHSRQFKV